MAERTKSPMIKDVEDPGPHPDPAAVDRAVPPRSSGMQARQTKSAKQRRSRESTFATGTSRNRSQAGDDATGAEFTLAERLRNWLRSAVVTGYGISLLLHLLILLGMALWVLPQLVESTSVTTVVESDSEAPQPFDPMDDVHLELPAGSEDLVLPKLTEALSQDAQHNLLEHQFLRDVTAAETQGDGGASGTEGGFHLLEPKNAVKAGSFSAWTIPIAQRPGEQVKAGDEPRPGQDYHIVIQLKVPGERRLYIISDLSGRVIGTDGYVQIIPAHAYYQEEDGRLIRARLGSRLPIVDGVAQILVRVPGAEALVKDTIVVKSKRLDEEQTLELIFGQAAGARRP